MEHLVRDLKIAGNSYVGASASGTFFLRAWYFEDLERHLEQTNNLHFSQLPDEVLGLSGVAKWTGQVQNGGTSQYFSNCLIDTNEAGAYAQNLISETKIVLSKIGDNRIIDIYTETLRTFISELDYHLNPPNDYPFYRSPRNRLLDDEIYSLVDVFYETYSEYSNTLKNMIFFNDREFNESVDKIVQESGLIIRENSNPNIIDMKDLNFFELGYSWEDVMSGKVDAKVAVHDVMAARFSIGLANIVRHVNGII